MAIDIDISAVLPADAAVPDVDLDGYTDAQLEQLNAMLQSERESRELVKRAARLKENAEIEKNRVVNCKSFPKFAKKFKDLKARAKAFKQKVTVVIPIEFSFFVDTDDIFSAYFSIDNGLGFEAKLGASYKGTGRNVLKTYLDNLCNEVLQIVPKEITKEFEAIRKDAAKFKAEILDHDLRLSDFG